MKSQKNYNIHTTISAREMERGKAAEAIKASRDGPVLIIKNSKPTSIIISYEQYLKLTEDKNNEK